MLLVALAGAAGWTSIHQWQHASAESQRINVLIQNVQQMRGDLYRQMKELFDAIFLQDPMALEEYASFSRNAEKHFIKLRTYAVDQEELQAIDELQASYDSFLQATSLVLKPPKRLTMQQLRRILDTDLETGVLIRFEAAAAQTEALLAAKQQQLREQLQQSKLTALKLFLIPVGLAAALLFFSHFFLKRAIVRPIDDILHATTEISAGRLDYTVPQASMAELNELALAINRMAEALKHSQEALARSQKQAAQGALVPMLAHNIRNPLASIRAIAQVADNPSPDPETHEALRDIIGTVDRLERWTGSLLAYLLPLQPHLAQTNLQSILRGALAPLQARLSEKSITLELPPPMQPIPLTTDESLLEQALYNLLLNAVDASPLRSKLRVTLALGEDAIKLGIIDQGPGMPFIPDAGDLSPGPSTKRFGTGLGIPFAFKVCEALGYRLDFSPAATGGTHVTLTLPR